MLIDFNDDERMLTEAVRRFAEQQLAPAMPRHLSDHEFPTALVQAFGQMGFMGTSYDPEYGGGGLGTCGATLVAELLARVEPSFAAIFLCNSAPTSLIARYGNDAQKRQWLQAINEGKMIASFGVTEPQGGSDVAGVKTTAVLDGDEYVINGQKMFSTNAGTPLHGFSTVVAVTDPDAGAKRLSSFIVPVGTPGFSVGKPARKIGWRFADSVELFFDNVRIPKEYLIGQRGDGLKQVLTVLSVGRILVGATGLGLARRAIDLAKSFGRDRKVLGKPILEHQGLSFPLADILTKIHAAELMVRNSATLVDEGRPFRNETGMTKLFASELAVEAALKAIQVHGAYGVFEEYPVSGLLGEAKVLEIAEGTSEIQRLVIARELLD
ncbi:acyl-CoA dehydrogenase [Advenella kashmirensis WT001]|uniref:Acyl-CoA dehydrogenase n=1 Tax=Advenella kashmirensis (strain DSM 17095 / LMG 22695 / WT001) TaxID=1036672 RepID=I3UFI8_ADVKW|nr:acyl-CoA dehydrogenase family protein [Advenella kashmirensis]AFK63776.1 acyl-CoA dehydrogenase [Advenella kashmirensis WT001]